MKVHSEYFTKIEDPDQPVFLIGDIHGDLGLLLCLLHDCAQVINDNFMWKPRNNSVVVLLGDMVDRNRPGDTPMAQGPCAHAESPDVSMWLKEGSVLREGLKFAPGEIPGEELLIQLYLNKLNAQAVEQGGQIFKIIGNHEVMNIDASEPHNDDPHLDPHYLYATPMGREMRKYYPLERGSLFAQAIMTDNAYMILQLGVWVLVHGGIRGFAAQSNISLLHSINPVMRKYFTNKYAPCAENVLNFILRNGNSIVWDRTFGFDECNTRQLQQILGNLHAHNQQVFSVLKIQPPSRPERLAIGHCTQMVNEVPSEVFVEVVDSGPRWEQLAGKTRTKRGPKGICFGCSGLAHRLDTAMSRAFDTDDSIGEPVDEFRLPQLLEVRADGRVIGVRRLKSGLWLPARRSCSNFPEWLNMKKFEKMMFDQPW